MSLVFPSLGTFALGRWTMSMSTTSPPEQGQLVNVRQRRYVVAEVDKSALPVDPLRRSPGETSHLVTLSSVEDDALGEELRVIWELEPGVRVIEKVALPEPTGFDDPARLDAFLDAVRWGASSAADVKNVQSPFRSGIDIEDYQLDPVVRAVQMPRANLLIADDVGLGKTIEAGMVILELIIRHRARRVLVVCPAGLQVQWHDQMRDKFGLNFRIVDSDLMKRLRRERGIHVNPWTHSPRLITSIDFLKRERPLRLFKDVLPREDEAKYPRRFDILVVDEAHNCAPSGRGKYATDSLRTAALRTLVPHFEHKLFLTATPHNGYIESFTALLELLDNQRFARGTMPDRKQLDLAMVRRMKSEFKRFDGLLKFPERKIVALEIEHTEEERALHAALREYSGLRRSSFRDNAEKFASEFVLKTLKKRLFSCPSAFARTLAQHGLSLRTSSRKKSRAKPSVPILQRQIARVDEDYADDSAYEDATGDAVDAASLLFRTPDRKEEDLLREMKEQAEAASTRPDSKAKVLIQWLRENLRPNGKWNDERVIIFTEYRATQIWLQERLAVEGFTAGDRLLTLYGGMDSDRREEIKAAFQHDPKVTPVRILLATDAASEGIDLQNHCSKLIHYEIPWNPNRMEQRNGRIDRHGQENEVHIYHFVGKGYEQRQQAAEDIPPGKLEGDLEFLMRAAQKVNNIREDLGKVGPVIAEQVEQAMLGHRTRLETARAEEDAKPVRKMLKFERDLRKRVEELRSQLHETKRELRLSPENILKVVEVALELADQPRLIPAEVEDIWPHSKRQACPVFHLPALRGSWQYCAEGLRHLVTDEMRPIVFDHGLAEGRDDVVLAHLNHRLVQMSLRLLRAEVWSVEGKKKLHRITARTVPNAALDDPAMIAHARAVVIGGDSHRLHEQIISAGGFLKSGRFSRMKVGQVTEALASASDEEPSEKVRDILLGLCGKHQASLAKALEVRMNQLVHGMQRSLKDREEKEASDIKTILTELRKSIEDKLKDSPMPTLPFEGWSDSEWDQYQRNASSLRARLREIPAEIEREVAAIRQRFADPQPRMFPVAITFLVPEKMAEG